jgi:sialate O-acetylesterase
MTPDQALAKMQAMSRGEITLADLGENTAALLRRATAAPSPARIAGKSELATREMERIPRVSEDLRTLMSGSKDFYTDVLDLTKKRAEEAKLAGKPFAERAPQGPDGYLKGNSRPGNIFNGVLLPTIGYGIKGAIWYQGESNASRAHEYRALFPFMISHWRELWKQGDFPFYWVQLADFREEKPMAGDSDWAELREAQTLTMDTIKNGGQAVIIDLGEAKDIHPKNKRDVAERLARWALNKDYGVQALAHRIPQFKSAAFKDGKANVAIDTFGSALTTFDVAQGKGFALCGEDKRWVWADTATVGTNTIEVSSKAVAKPIAVRYAWSDNPVCNVYSRDGLPLTPFRSDDFPMITAPKAP